MLTTLPNRVSALLADPFHAAMQELNQEVRWNHGEKEHLLRKTIPLSIWETEDAFFIDADVPGIPLDDLEVSLEKGEVTIRGERKPTRQTSGRYDERFYGRFERTVALSEWVDCSSIKASLQDGILQLMFAKRPESQPQRVKISYGNAAAGNQHIEAEAA